LGFHHSLLQSITFISQLNALDYTKLRTSSHTVVPYTHTPLVQKLHCQTPIKYTTNISEPLRISVKYSFILPDDGSHTIRNMSEWSLILCLLKIFIQR